MGKGGAKGASRGATAGAPAASKQSGAPATSKQHGKKPPPEPAFLPLSLGSNGLATQSGNERTAAEMPQS